jgi:hypothetical protein
MTQQDQDLLAILKHVDGVLISKGGWDAATRKTIWVAETEGEERWMGLSTVSPSEAVASLRREVKAKLQEVRS